MQLGFKAWLVLSYREDGGHFHRLAVLERVEGTGNFSLGEVPDLQQVQASGASRFERVQLCSHSGAPTASVATSGPSCQLHTKLCSGLLCFLAALEKVPRLSPFFVGSLSNQFIFFV